jgi:hypothetical protein
LASAVLSAEQTLVQTSVFTHRPVSLHESGDNDNDNDNDHNNLINEDMFLIFMLSNKTRIPCVSLVQIISPKETRDEVKYTKMIQYYIRNVLNATHHTSHPRNVLPFFSEVPNDSLLN